MKKGFAFGNVLHQQISAVVAFFSTYHEGKTKTIVILSEAKNLNEE
jgi:hypothetical protein